MFTINFFSDSKECQDWVDTINFVASSLSAPPLPGAVGSQRKFQRPLMPSTKTKLSMVGFILYLAMVTFHIDS